MVEYEWQVVVYEVYWYVGGQLQYMFGQYLVYMVVVLGGFWNVCVLVCQWVCVYGDVWVVGQWMYLVDQVDWVVEMVVLVLVWGEVENFQFVVVCVV